MSQEDTCKPRFKGIENFLRRIAFNLGNSPSQTEVKIISCIPIDVTDLQQKIVFLEKELSDAKKQKSTTKNKNKFDCNRFGSERRAMCDTSTASRSVAISQCDNNPSLDFDFAGQNLSNTSYEFSSHSKPLIKAIYERSASTQSVKSKWDKHKLIANKCVRNIFRKRKKKKQTQDRGRTQFVYYAHTDYEANIMPKVEELSYSYLSDVFRRHYDPKLVLNEYSDTSHFSEPVCRDLKPSCRKIPCESEVCSCCHGRFQNVDIYMNDIDINGASVFHDKTTKNVKNETKLVDLLPVKEKSVDKHKLRNEYRKLRTKNEDWWPEHVDTKHRYCCNYQTKDNNEFNVSNKQTKYKHTCREHSTHTRTAHPKTSNIYKDLYTPATRPHYKDKVTKGFKENIYSSQIKTALYDCTKTEAMLNEIKRMLLSVLTELKNNNEVGYLKDDKRKRDAVIQNDYSHNDMQRSTFLQSFMCNGSNYCTNPYLLPYAGQVPLAQYCFSNMPFQPLKFPINKVPLQTCAFYPKIAVTRSTNTDNINNGLASENKQTEKLIKEIYKSVNTNVENPSNDESCNLSEQKTTSDSGSNSKVEGICRDASLNVSNIKRDAQVEALLSSLTSYTTSNVVYTAITSKSGYDTKENVHKFTKTDDISEEDEYTDTAVSTSDITRTTKDGKKTGVLTKMFSVFKKKKINKDEETEMSDTDDYDTVYTEYTDKANNTPKINNKPTAGINIRVPANRSKNKRKTEEECRKRWIEDLLNEESRYYAPKNNTQSYKPYVRAYAQDYEARAAFVVPNKYNMSNPPKYDNANKMCKLPQIRRNKRSYLKNPTLMRCGRDWKKFIIES